MIDTIKISKQISEEVRDQLPQLLDTCRETIDHKTGDISLSGTLRNLKVYTSGAWCNISGSLTKFVFGNNVQNMTIHDIRWAFSHIASKIGINLTDAAVRRFDVGFTFEMNHHPSNYLQMIIYESKRTERNAFNDGENGLQFVNNTITLSFYNKGKEIAFKGGKVPDGFSDNLLRYEWQQKKYPERVLGHKLYVADLCNASIWERLLKRYKGRYFNTVRSFSFGGATIEEFDNAVRSVHYE